MSTTDCRRPLSLGCSSHTHAPLCCSTALTWGALVMECLTPLLLFVPRLRWLGALGLTGFHIGIHLCMTVNW